MSVEQIVQLCVDSFSLSSTRKPIMEGFLKIVEMLKEQDIPCELLVDGSFLTEEIDPEDIDFAVVVSPEVYGKCAPSQLKVLDWIGDDKAISQTHLCDCYLCVNLKEGDPGWFEGFTDRLWWLNFYGKSKVIKRNRGVVVIKLGEKVIQ